MLRGNPVKSTARKPLVDISNGGKASRCSTKKKDVIIANGNGDDRQSRRRRLLLLLRSDLSTLVAQIDDLVAKVLEDKMVSRLASEDIESFGNVISDMISSLKPWASRLDKTFGSKEKQFEQPSETELISCSSEGANVAPSNISGPDMDLIVSPSPLVSWRAGVGGDSCKLESGRQLFLLTPLPKPKNLSSKSMVSILHDEEDQHATVELLPSTVSRNAHPGMSGQVGANLAVRSVSKSSADAHPGMSGQVGANLAVRNVSKSSADVSKGRTSGTTLCSPLKFSNSKSRRDAIFLSTPCLKSSIPKSCALLDLIPENISEQVKKDSEHSADLFGGEVSQSVASRYQELLGLKPTHNFTTKRNEENETLDWFLSPPKTCILMEPVDERPMPMPANNIGVMLATPLLMNVESTVRKGQHPGENTLKKELWTRFEQVSTDGLLHFDASVFGKNARKGFLDMLEEASCETTD